MTANDRTTHNYVHCLCFTFFKVCMQMKKAIRSDNIETKSFIFGVSIIYQFVQ